MMEMCQLCFPKPHRTLGSQDEAQGSAHPSLASSLGTPGTAPGIAAALPHPTCSPVPPALPTLPRKTQAAMNSGSGTLPADITASARDDDWAARIISFSERENVCQSLRACRLIRKKARSWQQASRHTDAKGEQKAVPSQGTEGTSCCWNTQLSLARTNSSPACLLSMDTLTACTYYSCQCHHGMLTPNAALTAHVSPTMALLTWHTASSTPGDRRHSTDIQRHPHSLTHAWQGLPTPLCPQGGATSLSLCPG